MWKSLPTMGWYQEVRPLGCDFVTRLEPSGGLVPLCEEHTRELAFFLAVLCHARIP